MTRSAILTGLLALALLVARAAAADEAPAEGWTRHADPTGLVSLDLPTAWKPEAAATSGTPPCVLRIRVTVPGVEGPLLVRVFHLRGLADPLPQAYTERPVIHQREKAVRSWVESEPIPHLLLDVEEEGRHLRLVHAYRIVRGNGFTIAFEGPQAGWPALAEAAYQVVATLRADVPPWPAVPEGYARKERDGFVYHVHPDAHERDVRDYHRNLRKLQKAFEKWHGKLHASADHPATIVFHPHKGLATSLDATAADHRTGQRHEDQQRRVFAVPLDPSQAEERADVAYALWGLFFWTRYGCGMPAWLYEGETLIAHMEAHLGAALPTVSPWVKSQPADPPAFADLPALEATDLERFRKASVLYVALLRTGATKYRTAFKRFLAALDQGQDWHAAATTHVGALDQDALRADARELLARRFKTLR